MIDENEVRALLSSSGVRIEHETSTNFMVHCINPQHRDSDPSMSIRKDTGLFNCFGCGIKGNFYSLYHMLTNTYYKDKDSSPWGYSVYKQKIYENPIKTYPTPTITHIGNLLNPKDLPEIRSKLREWGIYKDSFIDFYGITYCKSATFKYEAYPDVCELMPFDDRICVPIYDQQSHLINIEGRTVRGSPKKVLYLKGGHLPTLYNWNNIDPTQDVVIVEGIKDFWKVWNVYPNTVAMFHDILTVAQVELLKRVTGELIFFIDNDKGGFLTLSKADEQFDIEFRCAIPPNVGEDPNDCSLSTIQELLNDASYYNEYIVKKALQKGESIGWSLNPSCL